MVGIAGGVAVGGIDGADIGGASVGGEGEKVVSLRVGVAGASGSSSDELSSSIASL